MNSNGNDNTNRFWIDTASRSETWERVPSEKRLCLTDPSSLEQLNHAVGGHSGGERRGPLVLAVLLIWTAW